MKASYLKTLGRLRSKTLEAIRAGRYRANQRELHDGGGLYLRLNPSGGAYWIFCYMVAGRKGKVGVGSLGPVDARAARNRAHELRAMVRAKVDPLSAAKAEQPRKAGQTFDEAAGAFIARMHKAKQHARTILCFERWQKNPVRPVLGRVVIDDITTRMVAKAIVPLMIESYSSGERCGRFIKRVIDQAKAEGYADQKAINPASKELLKPLVGHIKRPRKRKHKAMPYGAVPELVAKLAEKSSPVAQGLLLAILSGVRTAELYRARWGEIDGEVWRLPLEHMKVRDPDLDDHEVPISTGIEAVLARLRPLRNSDYIFQGRGKAHIQETSMLTLLKQHLGYDCTVHGFRSTISDWGLEQGGFSPEVMDAVLAHKVPGVRGSYQRTTYYKTRVAVMQGWSDFCHSAVPANRRRHLKLAA